MPNNTVEKTPEDQIAELQATNNTLKTQVEELTKQVNQYANAHGVLAKRYQNLLELYNGLFEQYITKGTTQKNQ